jgi:TRAP transporter TAXI family solute receptor
MLRFLGSGLALMLSIAGCCSVVQAQTAPSPRGAGAEARAKANEWTVGLAAGLPEDSFLPFAAEIARNLNESGNLRVLPLATPGAANNIKDLLFLNGIDVALTNTDVLHHLRTVEKIDQIEKRVQYLTALYLSEVHLVVRPEIKTIQDLAGKKVGFNVPGAGPTVTAPIIFQRLNIKVEPVYVSNVQALAMMKTGEIAGLVHAVAKPNGLIAGFANDAGFKLLPIPYDKLDDFYVPAILTSADYPNFIKPGEKVETVAVQAVLAVLDRQQSADRSRRVKRFVEQFFDRFDRFKGLGYQAAWKDVNLAAQVPGWTRHELATEKLQQEVKKARALEPRVVFMNAADQERLFQRFLVWRSQQTR